LLGISRVLIPPHPGLCSAYGALAANWRVDRVWTIFGRSSNLDVDGVAGRLETLCREAIAELRADGFNGEPVLLRSIDMRYAGQNYEREVPVPAGPFTAESVTVMIERFAAEHDRFYGFSLEGEPVEFVNVRVSAIGPSDLKAFAQPPLSTAAPRPIEQRPVAFRGRGYLDTSIYRREDLSAGFAAEGPLVIEEVDSTSVVHPGDRVVVRPDGLLELTVSNARSAA
jgi:N-methylhydantoinase A